jgi:hypothetical protein
MKSKVSLILTAAICWISCASNHQADYRTLVANGEFAKAREIIQSRLMHDKTVSNQLPRELQFEIERMERMRKDFTKTQQDVVDFIIKYIPTVTFQDLDRWEKERSLEGMMIDGERCYFNNAARNLFRINKECLMSRRNLDESRRRFLATTLPAGLTLPFVLDDKEGNP